MARKKCTQWPSPQKPEPNTTNIFGGSGGGGGGRFLEIFKKAARKTGWAMQGFPFEAVEHLIEFDTLKQTQFRQQTR